MVGLGSLGSRSLIAQMMSAPDLKTPSNLALSFDFLQLRHGSERGQEEERHPRDHLHPEGLAERAQEEPLPHQGRENNAGHYHQDDADAGVHVVRQREKKTEKGEQDDLGAQESRRRRRCQYRR